MQESTSKNSHENSWIHSSAAVAPTLIGASGGVFLASLIRNEARRPVALSLAALGVFALAPALVENIIERVNGPNTQRGSRRTLRRIRDAAADTEEFSEMENDLEAQMFVG